MNDTQQQGPGTTAPQQHSAPARFDRGSAATALRHPEALRRSSTDRKVAGVCGGIGRQTGIDPNIIRVAAAVLALSGIGIALYLILWIVMPDEGAAQDTTVTRNLPEQLRTGAGLGIAIGAGTIGLGIILQAMFGSVLPFDFPFPFPLLLVGAVIAFFWHRSRGQNQKAVTSFQAEHPAGPRLDLSRDPDDPGAPGPEFWARPDPLGLYRQDSAIVPATPAPVARVNRKAPALLRIGTLVATAAGFATVAIVTAAGVTVPALLFLGVPLTIFGAGLVITSRFGTAGGLATLGVASAAAAIGIASVSGGPWTVQEVHPHDVAAANALVLPSGVNAIDLSSMSGLSKSKATTIHLGQHNGALIVRVPDNVDVVARADVTRGGYELFGQDDPSGFRGQSADRPPVTDLGPDGRKLGSDPVLNLDLSVENGFVVVERAD